MPQAAVSTAAAMVAKAHSLVAEGWCQGAHARDAAGGEVPAWSPEARSWSLLGALLAGWHLLEANSDDADVVAHLADARALGEATEAVGAAIGTASLEQWNDDPGRTRADVIAALDRARSLLDSSY